MDVGLIIEVEQRAAALEAMDYFEVLRVPRSAGLRDVKAAYYRESRAFHPDRFAALPSAELKELIGRIYRRVNEAYMVLRDDVKRAKYLADVSGPDRAIKLRFSEEDEARVRDEQKRRAEEQIGTTPNGRKFYAAALAEIAARRWESAERALRSALMYEPANA
ncbi:MAG TPA: DnaJ domain-containing protein, partial [Anaeromyxobacteraceae bacterium]|nr:DnaJ domain-containing protein [Anaeromyxobacteraceae bacterium]